LPWRSGLPGEAAISVVVQAKVRGFIELFKKSNEPSVKRSNYGCSSTEPADYAIFMLDPGVVSSPGILVRSDQGHKADEIIGQHFSLLTLPTQREGLAQL